MIKFNPGMVVIWEIPPILNNSDENLTVDACNSSLNKSYVNIEKLQLLKLSSMKNAIKDWSFLIRDMCQSVIFGSLTLIWKFNLDFGKKVNFWKTWIDHVKLKFLATNENQKLIISEEKDEKWRKIDINQARVKLLFAFLLQSTTRVELSCSW